jgi:hypothetical protein
LIDSPLQVGGDDLARGHAAPLAPLEPIAAMLDQFVEKSRPLPSIKAVGITEEPEAFTATIKR